MPTDREAIQGTLNANAPDSLSYTQAVLYSHYSKLRWVDRGLARWTEADSERMYQEVIRLIDASRVLSRLGEISWKKVLKRAAEILEWLSHHRINTSTRPLCLLAAGAYQLAGYPAMAASVIKQYGEQSDWSELLKAFLSNDFTSLYKKLPEYWSHHTSAILPEGAGLALPQDTTDEHLESVFSDSVHNYITIELVRCLGLLASAMRWGVEGRTDLALRKLNDLSDFTKISYSVDSWLLVELMNRTAKKYLDDSIHNSVQPLRGTMSLAGQVILDRYARQAYEINKAVLWPSQQRGIEHLATLESFVLCTPTGSGKTTVAELGALQSLYLDRPDLSDLDLLLEDEPIVLYLVPSRALAGEVENKFSRTFKLDQTGIQVTGLYGGTDWGPTDSWLNLQRKTLLICTYEKAEALIRFLGPLFMHRVKAVIVDEAHCIAFGGTDFDKESLANGENRSLRLESLSMRLFNYLDPEHSRVIALSAVAADTEKPLAKWTSGSETSTAVKMDYRSTRQLIGRLECSPTKTFEIQFDLLDRVTKLSGTIRGDEAPYIPNPIPRCPGFDATTWYGTEKGLRPYLFWAAMNFAASGPDNRKAMVLVSVNQFLEQIAKGFLDLLEEWQSENLPEFFAYPTEPEKIEMYENCCRICEDLCGVDSYEYQLLRKGIIAHHGKLPNKVKQCLMRLAEEKIVHIVIATSTLSEGVNLPFEYILMHSLLRRGTRMSVREFLNLAGRAGRPGVSSEGITLVLLNSGNSGWMQRRNYEELIDEIVETSVDPPETPSNGPLENLLNHIRIKWHAAFPGNGENEFSNWLETISPITDDSEDPNCEACINALDSLDSVLLSIMEELEKREGQELPIADVEEGLIQAWNRAYSAYSTQHEADLRRIFLDRGKALKQEVYPSRPERQTLYYAGLPPRKGRKLIDLYPQIRTFLQEAGPEYAIQEAETRLSFVTALISMFHELPGFEFKETKIKVGRRRLEWDGLLKWWIYPAGFDSNLDPKHLSKAHDYVDEWFVYKASWWLSNIIAFALNEANANVGQTANVLDAWPSTGLPWITFWIKEIIAWGTLDPVAAYLMAMKFETIRANAEEAASEYYNNLPEDFNPDDVLNPNHIRVWAEQEYAINRPESPPSLPMFFNALPSRDFTGQAQTSFKVMPMVQDSSIYWLDPAGYLLANSDLTVEPGQLLKSRLDFEFNAESNRVSYRYV